MTPIWEKKMNGWLLLLKPLRQFGYFFNIFFSHSRYFGAKFSSHKWASIKVFACHTRQTFFSLSKKRIYFCSFIPAPNKKFWFVGEANSNLFYLRQERWKSPWKKNCCCYKFVLRSKDCAEVVSNTLFTQSHKLVRLAKGYVLPPFITVILVYFYSAKRKNKTKKESKEIGGRESRNIKTKWWLDIVTDENAKNCRNFSS